VPGQHDDTTTPTFFSEPLDLCYGLLYVAACINYEQDGLMLCQRIWWELVDARYRRNNAEIRRAKHESEPRPEQRARSDEKGSKRSPAHSTFTGLQFLGSAADSCSPLGWITSGGRLTPHFQPSMLELAKSGVLLFLSSDFLWYYRSRLSVRRDFTRRSSQSCGARSLSMSSPVVDVELILGETFRPFFSKDSAASRPFPMLQEVRMVERTVLKVAKTQL